MMKLKRVLRVLMIAVIAAVFCTAPISIANAPQVHAASNFVIEDYDIEMVVNEDDTYEITETLDVRFTYPSHGIYRAIPYRTELNRDGQHSLFFAKVKDFEMLSGQPWKKEQDGDYYRIKIGDPDVYANTDTTYKFRYVFDNRGDHFNGADEVYYNLIGTSWEAMDIEHVSFKVTFPKAIDPEKVGVKTGYEIDVPFDVTDDLVVSGETSENVMGGLTIRAVLPEGYFTAQAGTSSILFYVLIAALVAMAAAGFVLWRRYGKDPKEIETVEFNPPDRLTAPEIAYLLKEELTNTQVISILLTLADKGYLKITEYERETRFRKKKVKEYRITRLKEYDDDVIGEKTFMDGLFEDGEDTVEVKELENKFYKTVGEVKKEIEGKFDDKLYDARAGKYSSILCAAGFIAYIVLLIVSKVLNGSPFLFTGDVISTLILYVLQIGMPVMGFYGVYGRIKKAKKNPFGYIGWIVAIIVGIGLALLSDTFIAWQLPLFMIGSIMCLVLFVMAGLCERKTDYYVGLLGKIKGYKNFLQVAEKDQMEKLAEEDPGYYYRNLAFAFALGVTAVYAQHFIKLATEPPTWYDSPGMYYAPGTAFDASGMMDSIDNMFSSMSSSMTSSPSGDGGGSFSGGGGGGGGGGGSW